MRMGRLRFLPVVLAITLAYLLAGCISYYPIPNEQNSRMDSSEVKRILTKENNIQTITVDSGTASHAITNTAVVNHKLNLIEQNGSTHVINLNNITTLKYGHPVGTTQYFISVEMNDKYEFLMYARSLEAGRRAGDAIFVLMQDAKNEGQGDLRFEETVKAYRLAAFKPVMSEDVRRYKVQAEAAVRGKHFEEAVDLYDEALSIAPWWPEGHFNRALVLAEIGEHETAIKEMKRYLRLVPDAPDARAAQDKIYEWEGAGRK